MFDLLILGIFACKDISLSGKNFFKDTAQGWVETIDLIAVLANIARQKCSILGIPRPPSAVLENILSLGNLFLVGNRNLQIVSLIISTVLGAGGMQEAG